MMPPMQAGPPSPPGQNLTPKTFAIWTVAMTLAMAIGLGGLVGAFGRVGPVEFTVGFLPTFVLVMSLGWTGRFDRLLPAAVATLLVAFWPLYRWLARGDVATAKAYLFVAGFINVMLLMSTGMEFVRRRGWLVESPMRRRLIIGSMLVKAISILIGWPTGVWHTGLEVAWFAAMLSALFWPAGRRSSPPPQSVTV
jgi:hypothetical protein